jgi:4,4'-diaponeurosporenoate glycosyltransferase
MTVALLIFWALLGSAGFVLAARMFRRSDEGAGLDAARVSIVIPARNEAHNLPRLLRSITEQDVKPLEVIVVDDASTDGTAEVAKAHGAKVISPPELPDGWRGKTWACHQGARAASGDLLVFMDADTWFEPGGLVRVLAIYQNGALSVVPYHAVERPYEDLSMFFNLCMAAGTVPDGLSGQFLLVGREDLERAGGHESVRGKVLENFHLAENFRAAGIAVRGVTGSGMVALRMYPEGFASLVEGWTKGFAAGAGKTPPRVMAMVVAWMTALMLPPLLAWLAGDWRIGLVTWLACVAQLAWIARRLGSFGLIGMIFYQVPLCFFFGMFAWASMRSGKKVSWKGREIHAD